MDGLYDYVCFDLWLQVFFCSWLRSNTAHSVLSTNILHAYHPPTNSLLFFVCSSAALIMTMVTVLDEWRPCISNAEKRENQWQNKNNKNRLKKQTQSQPSTILVVSRKWNTETTSQWCRSGSSTSLPARVPLYSWMHYSHHIKCLNFVLLKKTIFPSCFSSLPSLNVSCSLASWYVMALAISSLDDLQNALNHFVLLNEPDNSYLGSLSFKLLLGTFPLLPCLPIRLGQHGVLDIFPRPTRAVEDKQFLEAPSMVARSKIPQMMSHPPSHLYPASHTESVWPYWPTFSSAHYPSTTPLFLLYPLLLSILHQPGDDMKD